MALFVPIDSALGRAAIIAIGGYQRYVSPYKGFRCAHRVLHGGRSCSQYAADVITSHGLAAGLRELRSRFAECRAAAGLVREHRARELELNAQREFDEAFDLPPGKPAFDSMPAVSPEQSGAESERRDRASTGSDSACLGPDFYCPGIPLDCCFPPADALSCDLSALDCAGCDLPVDCCGAF